MKKRGINRVRGRGQGREEEKGKPVLVLEVMLLVLLMEVIWVEETMTGGCNGEAEILLVVVMVVMAVVLMLHDKGICGDDESFRGSYKKSGGVGGGIRCCSC